MKYEARMRMVDKFISMLNSEEYLYKNEESTERLVALVYNAIYSLSRINTADWNIFLGLFKDAKVNALAPAALEKEKTENYNKAIALLLSTFEKYNQYLRSLNDRAPQPANAAI